MGTPSNDDLKKFFNGLRAITSTANVNSITQAEQRFVTTTAGKFKGFLELSNAFRSVVVDTIDCGNGAWAPHIATASPLYIWFLPRLALNFQWLCGAEQQAFAGYPMPAFAQLRNIFDSTVITSAVAQQIATFEDAEGIAPGKTFDQLEAKKKRKATERLIFHRMTGAQSGLSQSTLKELQALDDMFDWETHGQRLGATQSISWLQRQGPLHFLPEFDERSFGLFMNRCLETVWMVHRLLPLARPAKAPVPQHWRHNWDVLDAALHTNTFSLTAQFGKPVGQAIVDFVTTKFPFSIANSLP